MDSALNKEDSLSTHSSDNEDSEVPTSVGSHAMSMIMSEYNPNSKGPVPVKPTAAMNMIKAEYDGKLAEANKLTSNMKSEVRRAENKLDGSNSLLLDIKKDESHILNIKKDPVALVASQKVITNHNITSPLVKTVENDIKKEPKTESDVSAAMSIPKKEDMPLDFNKQERVDFLTRREREEMIQRKAMEEPMELDTKSDTEKQCDSPPVSTSSMRTSVPPANSTASPAISTPPHSTASPSMVKSPMAALPAGIPSGLLGAYRPVIAAAGIPMGRLPGAAMMPAHHPQGFIAAPTGYMHQAHGLPAAHVSHLIAAQQQQQQQLALHQQMAAAAQQQQLVAAQQQLAAAGGLRLAAAPAGYMPAASVGTHMIPGMPSYATAHTGPYSHLGMPSTDPHMAAMAMAGVASPQLGTAVYPGLQMAGHQQQQQQLAMMQRAAAGYPAFLPRPPT